MSNDATREKIEFSEGEVVAHVTQSCLHLSLKILKHSRCVVRLMVRTGQMMR